LKILDRYMATAFARPFGYSLGLFALLVFLGHLFDHLTILLRTAAPTTAVLEYLALQVPYWTIRIVPVATLLATLMCMSELVRSGEWVAVLSSGYRPAQVVAPLAVCAALVGVLTFAAQELVLPYAYGRSKDIYEQEILKRPPMTVWHDVVLVSRPGQFVMAREFEPGAGRISRIVMDTYGPEQSEIDALEADWDGDRWVFHNGVVRRFQSDRLLPAKETPFTVQPSDLAIPPAQMTPVTKEPDEMTLVEVVRHLDRLKRLGASTRLDEVALHSKLAFPLANIVIFMLGIPFGLRMRASRSLNFATALGVAFVFWWVLSMGQTLGEAGRLPPWIGGWLGNILFGAIGLAGLARAGL
jgi:lipopolysaccharide export system permease protein